MGNPQPRSPALDDLVAAFGRRGKAIRYQGRLSVTADSGSAEDPTESVNVHFEELCGLRLSLTVWSTHEWSLVACQPGPRKRGGWVFKHELQGGIDTPSAEEIVRAFEATMLVAYQPPDAQYRFLQELWHVHPEN